MLIIFAIPESQKKIITPHTTNKSGDSLEFQKNMLEVEGQASTQRG